MRAHRVVIHPPGFNHLPCVLQIHEPVLVQAFIAELPVEALDERILCGLATLDEMQRHLVLIRPLIHDATGKLGSVVYLNRGWGSTSFSQPWAGEHPGMSGTLEMDFIEAPSQFFEQFPELPSLL